MRRARDDDAGAPLAIGTRATGEPHGPTTRRAHLIHVRVGFDDGAVVRVRVEVREADELVAEPVALENIVARVLAAADERDILHRAVAERRGRDGERAVSPTLSRVWAQAALLERFQKDRT